MEGKEIRSTFAELQSPAVSLVTSPLLSFGLATSVASGNVHILARREDKPSVHIRIIEAHVSKQWQHQLNQQPGTQSQSSCKQFSNKLRSSNSTQSQKANSMIQQENEQSINHRSRNSWLSWRNQAQPIDLNLPPKMPRMVIYFKFGKK